jgi:hypothetical protein
MATQYIFHPVLELELAFLEGYFFDLLGFWQVWLTRKFVEAIVEFVVLRGELSELFVSFEKKLLQLLDIRGLHARPPLKEVLDSWEPNRTTRARLVQAVIVSWFLFLLSIG